MTTDIKELVKRLRSAARAQSAGGGWADPCAVENTIDWNAADALEAMAGEVERYRERHKGFMTLQAALERVSGERASAVAERDRLQLANARMKAALDEAVKWMDGCAVSGGYPTWHAKARKALMGGDA